jgi:beta-lactamase regulating signal transducer with metallopeptidase domain
MTAYLLAGAIKGSLLFILVWVLERIAPWRMRAAGRRVWWLLIPVAFLAPVYIPLPSSPVLFSLPVAGPNGSAGHVGLFASAENWGQISGSPGAALPWIFLLWLAGVVASILFAAVPTFRAHAKWSLLRLSTEPALLNLLEDSKALAGVRAPIGLVVSDAIAAPALLGWLRPRLLLPQKLVGASSSGELKAIFLHELAHFKMLDIPVNWLFIVVRSLHWFNPFAYFAGTGWARFREEAADETAIRWLNEPTAIPYGEVLLKALAQCPGGAAPSGALAIGESVENLKRRMLMIRTYSSKSTHGGLAAIIALVLAALMAVVPAPAQEDAATAAKREAGAAMDAWLGEIDAGNYAKSWADASGAFKAAVTSDQWVAALANVRTPLGHLNERKKVSVLYQTVTPEVGVNPRAGEYVIAQFDTSFENLKYAVETVTFKKEPDGVWRAAGYLTKPGQ